MHYSRISVSLVAALASPILALPHVNPLEQRATVDNHTLNRERADAVKAAFQHAWNGYKTYAFPRKHYFYADLPASSMRVASSGLGSRIVTGFVLVSRELCSSISKLALNKRNIRN